MNVPRNVAGGIGALTPDQLRRSNAYISNLILAGRSDEVAPTLAYSQLPWAARGTGMTLRPEVFEQLQKVLAGDYIGAYGQQWNRMLEDAKNGVYDASNFNLPLQNLPDGGAIQSPNYKPVFILGGSGGSGSGGGSVSDREFVRGLYVSLLGHEPDQAGLNFWTDSLSSGMTRDAVTTAFRNSTEYAARMAALQAAKDLAEGKPAGGGNKTGNGGGEKRILPDAPAVLADTPADLTPLYLLVGIVVVVMVLKQ